MWLTYYNVLEFIRDKIKFKKKTSRKSVISFNKNNENDLNENEGD